MIRLSARRNTAVAILGAAIAAVVASGCSAERDELPSVDRVVIVAIPEVQWSDLTGDELEHLPQLLESSAVANLSTRIADRNADRSDGYLTIGAGTRSIGANGYAFGRDETLGRDTVAAIVDRRTGTAPVLAISHIDIASLSEDNRGSEFGGRVGRLGTELERAGIATAVVGNADLGGPITADLMQVADRAAALALMNDRGEIGGAVGPDLLVADPAAPFGARLDEGRVFEAFDAVWNPNERAAVLVECSDLVRARAEAAAAEPGRAREQRATALAACDATIGELMRRQGDRDAIVIVSPTTSARATGLGVVAVAAAGVDGGYLQSASTRRAGYLQLSDVGPTVLDLLGLDVPSAMEGNRAWISDGDPRVTSRIERLRGETADAATRESLIPGATATLVVITVVLALLALVEWRLRLIGRRRLVAASFGLVGGLAGTYLPALVGGADDAVVVGFPVAISAIATSFVGAWLSQRFSPETAVAAVLGAFVTLFVVDLLSGARLQFNTLFGYSAAVAGRFAGLGNLAFALFSAAVLVAAVVIGTGTGARRVGIAGALLVGAVVIEGMPMWGGDVGGVLAMVPAFLAVYTMLSGREVRWWHPALWGIAAVGSVLAFALVDLLRPEELRTHLGRYLDEVRTDGWSSLLTTVGRRLEAGLGGARVAIWTLLVVAALLVVEFVMIRRLRAAEKRRAESPAVRALAVGVAILAVVSLVTNDSGLAAPLTMMAIVVPAAVVLFVGRHDAAASDRPIGRWRLDRGGPRTSQVGAAQ